MALRSQISSTTQGGGEVIIDGIVDDGGPGGSRHYVCDVLMLVDGAQVQWFADSSPDDFDRYEDPQQILVYWRDVPIPADPTPGVPFRLAVEWRQNSTGPAIATILAMDLDQMAIHYASISIPREDAAAKKAGTKPGA
jgi:hypothetical protein